MGDEKMINRKAFDATVVNFNKKYPKWRKGQTVFNVMMEIYPDKANSLRGSDIDPFYNDDNIDKFIEKCLDD